MEQGILGSRGGRAAESETLSSAIALTGTEAQIEWALRIRAEVESEFGRVAAALSLASANKPLDKRAETEAILVILAEKRAEVLAIASAGYFIKDWQESSGRVRRIIAQDPRYVALRASRFAGERSP